MRLILKFIFRCIPLLLEKTALNVINPCLTDPRKPAPPAPPSLHTDSLCNDGNPWVKNTIDRSDGCSVCVYHFNNVLTAVQFILVHVGHLRHSGYLRRLDHLRHMGHLRHLKSIVSTSLYTLLSQCVPIHIVSHEDDA